MPLRARVGRHANTGAQCQNWADDQYLILTFLNLIPAADGGAGGALTAKVVAGIASDSLYSAILRFQQQYFPKQKTGFVEPNGAVYQKMEQLASRPGPAEPKPEPKGQWNEFKSGSIPRALRKGLADDNFLSHVEVVEIIRSALANGTLSTSELDDLKMVADRSRSILPRSKQLLELFVSEVNQKFKDNLGPYRVTSVKQQYATNLICDFLRRAGSGKWPNLDRDIVGVGMLMRIAYPGLISQKNASLCGPAAMIFNVLSDNPGQYAKFAVDLFEKGEASIRNINIKPKANAIVPRISIFSYKPESHHIHQTDWFTLASIRNSENWLVEYNDVDSEVGGITTPMEMARWFSRAGYYDVREETNFFDPKDSVAGLRISTKTLDEANRLYAAGYRICLLINSQMVDRPEKAGQPETYKKSGSLADRHWVVLRSKIIVADGKVHLWVYTWGSGEHRAPKDGDMTLNEFYMNFFGYVAAKP